MNSITAIEAFSADTYDTPEETRHYMGDRILLRSRWWFYLLLGRDVIKYSRLARRGVYDDEMWINTCFQVFKYLEGCGGRFRIRGLDNLRKNREPLVIVSNHMSSMEAVIFPCIIQPFRPVNFVVKERLVKGSLFGPLVRSRNPVVVARQNPREDFRVVMQEGEKILEKGTSLVIFPQSTRSPVFIPEKFNSLGVKLARQAGVKVLPMAIKTDFWSDSKLIKGFGPLERKKPIYITFGEPLAVTGSGKEEHQHIVRFIASHLEKWRQPPDSLSRA